MEIISRRLYGRYAKGVNKHAAQTGQIIWAWNFLHSSLLRLFHQLVSPSNAPLALALWHTIQSDKAQREMLEAAASAVLLPQKNAAKQPKKTIKKHAKLLADILWLTKKIQELSTYRNDTAHTGISLAGTYLAGQKEFVLTVVPDARSGRPPAVARLYEVPVASYWRTVKGDFWVLARYAVSLAGRVNDDPDYGPLLRRPRLLTVPASKRIAPKKPRLPKIARRRHQPKP